MTPDRSDRPAVVLERLDQATTFSGQLCSGSEVMPSAARPGVQIRAVFPMAWVRPAAFQRRRIGRAAAPPGLQPKRGESADQTSHHIILTSLPLVNPDAVDPGDTPWGGLILDKPAELPSGVDKPRHGRVDDHLRRSTSRLARHGWCRSASMQSRPICCKRPRGLVEVAADTPTLALVTN